jgi:hypothetical protein
MRNAECGMKKISIAVSQPAVPGSRFGINNPHSPFPISYDNVNGNSGLYLLEGTIKYVFSIP